MSMKEIRFLIPESWHMELQEIKQFQKKSQGKFIRPLLRQGLDDNKEYLEQAKINTEKLKSHRD